MEKKKTKTKAIKKPKYVLNVICSQKDDRDYKPKVGIIQRLTSPVIYDAAPKFTAIKDQGSEGMCVGFSGTSWMEALSGGKVDLSERMAYENAQEFDEWEGNTYEGTSIKGFLKAAQKFGICEERFWKTVPGKPGKPTVGFEASGNRFRVGTYAILMDSNGKPKINEMCLKLASGCAILASIRVTNEFMKLNNRNNVQRVAGNDDQGGHAIAVVGYDKKNKLLKIRNSWGLTFGVSGYCYMTFDVFSEVCFDLWTFDKDSSMKVKSEGIFKKLVKKFKKS